MTMLGAALVGAGACGGPDGPGHRPSGSGPVVIRVPANAPTIQDAVDVAHVGDLVLVSPGVYPESVQVRVQRLTIRGTDRNTVIIDGESRLGTGVTMMAAGDSVENLTVRDFTASGVLATGLARFRVDHVTSYNNTHFGIGALHATAGTITSNYVSGQAKAGIYVAQCKPCDTDIAGNDVERNAVGVLLTNASASLYVHDNRIAYNRVGVTLATNLAQAYAPQSGAIIVSNSIIDNAEAEAPGPVGGGLGIGVDITGGSGNVVAKNLVTSNTHLGIGISDVGSAHATSNEIIANVLAGNGPDLLRTSTVAESNTWLDNVNLRGTPVESDVVESLPTSDGPTELSFQPAMVPSPQEQRPGPLDQPGPPVFRPAAIDPLSAVARASVPDPDSTQAP
jgi:hypothetical protein